MNSKANGYEDDTSLYTILCQKRTLYEAWKTIKGKNAAGGIDGITLSHFNENAYKHLSDLVDELKLVPFNDLTIRVNRLDDAAVTT